MDHSPASSVASFIDQLTPAARRARLTDREWADKAKLRPETLARLKQRTDCDLGTLEALAGAVGWRISLDQVPERTMPARMHRDAEAVWLDLCASGSLDVRRWLDAGPRYFAAGLALLLSNARGVDREGLTALADALYPGIAEPAEMNQWLARSPLRPSRFFPMIEQRMAQLAKTRRAAVPRASPHSGQAIRAARARTRAP